MKKQSNSENNLRNQILGFGEKSSKKSYFPELQKKVNELNRLRNLIDKIDTAVVLIEVESGNILDYNKSADSLFNCIQIKTNSANFLKTNFPHLDLSTEEKIKKNLSDIKLEINGNPRYFNIKTEFEKTENDYLLLMLFNDVTQQKEAEFALIESETRFRTMIEDAPIGAVISNNFKVTYVNRATLELFKSKNQNDLLFKNITDFIADESMSYLSEILEKRNSGLIELNRIELNGQRINGEIFDLLVSLTNINIGEGRSTLMFLYDVSKQKNIERYLQKAKETAEKSEKLKTEFLAQISHEIRTPINTILSFVNLLKEEFEESEIWNENEGFEIIRSASQRIIRTVDLILNMAEMQIGTYEPIVRKIDIINEVFLPLLAEYKSLAKIKNLELLFENKSRFTEIRIDLDEYTFSQIISNLIDNAIKYTIKGSIKIEIKDEINNKFSLHIRDTGIGISEEYLPHLFDAFSQEDMGYTRRFEGNGLGLALVKEYCKISNFEIKVDSQKDIGTTFSLYQINN